MGSDTVQLAPGLEQEDNEGFGNSNELGTMFIAPAQSRSKSE